MDGRDLEPIERKAGYVIIIIVRSQLLCTPSPCLSPCKLSSDAIGLDLMQKSNRFRATFA